MSILTIINWSLWGVAALIAAIALARRRSKSAVSAIGYIALLAGVAVVVGDVFLTIALRGQPIEMQALRVIPPLACLPLFGYANGWQWRELGLRWPEQSLRYWLAATAVLGAIGAALVGVGIAVVSFSDWTLPFGRPPFLPWALSAIVIAPVQEELIYRFALCTPAEEPLGKWTTITISGFIFAAIHYVYGNPGIDNFIGGFILAWSYLKSRSLVVPIVLHTLGNLFVYAALLAFELAV